MSLILFPLEIILKHLTPWKIWFEQFHIIQIFVNNVLLVK